ncbi:CheR family methyltransferase [Tropicimonas isoalkanivorans]|uniref:Chemotaxis protein methyltransferase n=1 Tax=Tropicimonas isoalkanivorans TaxID=441112 RepID=A0A1I1KCQ5_9RHOB|nr:protein-glutamate O-methyltransferase [Tropicimonas isoalkanivorans]SFC58649.1 chemotaxis protein methyltransferase CheR [Tropicimonas isoalkanivorans]
MTRPSAHPSGLSNADRRNFDIIAEIAHKEAGLAIPFEKAPMVFARLSKLQSRLGLNDAGEYCTLLTSSKGDLERRHLICALTTNVTSFFREAHHFDYMRKIIAPDLIARARAGDRIRIWSAGCSDGSEPYSIAMTLLDCCRDIGQFDIRILATDIDCEILGIARLGRYKADRLGSIPESYRRNFVEQVGDADKDAALIQVSSTARNLVHFRELNLVGHWPMKQKFDIIFCRNVLIYFDQDTQMRLWPRFEDACKPGGHLFIGHSERLPSRHTTDFRPIATTTYRRHPADTGRRQDREE